MSEYEIACEGCGKVFRHIEVIEALRALGRHLHAFPEHSGADEPYDEVVL